MNTALKVRISASYGDKEVLRGIEFDLCSGEVLGLVGSSGAGKSTLVLSLMGLMPWRGGSARGEVMLDGRNLLALPEKTLRGLRGRRISLVPQSPLSALNGAVNLRTHFDEAWRAHSKAGRDALLQRVRQLMQEVQLPDDVEFLRRRPAEISVGQAQRVLIALALLHEPAVLVADEPTSALDPVTQIQVVDLLKKLNRARGITMLYISHDLLSVIRLCDRVAVMDQGQIVEMLPVSELGHARHAATQRLIATLPVPPEVLLRYRDDSLQESKTYSSHPG
jgi:ABC-type glutathione transport system ATPase component